MHTDHQLLEWKRRPMKNGYPWVAFAPGVGWFFLWKSEWIEDRPHPWRIEHRPVRGDRDWRGAILNQHLATNLVTDAEAAQRAEELFLQMYPLPALANVGRQALGR
jgi:hypothetical protein